MSCVSRMSQSLKRSSKSKRSLLWKRRVFWLLLSMDSLLQILPLLFQNECHSNPWHAASFRAEDVWDIAFYPLAAVSQDPYCSKDGITSSTLHLILQGTATLICSNFHSTMAIWFNVIMYCIIARLHFVSEELRRTRYALESQVFFWWRVPAVATNDANDIWCDLATVQDQAGAWKTHCNHGCFIEGLELFDNRMFKRGTSVWSISSSMVHDKHHFFWLPIKAIWSVAKHNEFYPLLVDLSQECRFFVLGGSLCCFQYMVSWCLNVQRCWYRYKYHLIWYLKCSTSLGPQNILQKEPGRPFQHHQLNRSQKRNSNKKCT